MLCFFYKALAFLLCLALATASPVALPENSSNDFGMMKEDLQKRFEEINTKVITRLETLEMEVSKLVAENSQLKTSLQQASRANSDTMFLATISSTSISVSNGDRIIFDRDLINPGGHYNPEQGSYTAPFSGYYQFSVTKLGNDGHGAFFFLVDEEQFAFEGEWNSSDESTSGSCTIKMHLTAGPIVRIENWQSTGIYGTDSAGYIRSWFTGHLLYAL